MVRVIDDLDTVKRLQAGHGEWTDDMAPVSLTVCCHHVCPHPQLLSAPLPTCCDPTSPQALGRVGKVLKVFGDGNLRVAVGGQRWTFSPSCLVAYRPEEDANLDVAERARENRSAASASVAGGRKGSPWPALTSTLPPGSLSVALDKLRTQKSDPEHPGRLVVEAALGNVARALDLLRRHPEQASFRPALRRASRERA